MELLVEYGKIPHTVADRGFILGSRATAHWEFQIGGCASAQRLFEWKGGACRSPHLPPLEAPGVSADGGCTSVTSGAGELPCHLLCEYH